MDEKSNREERLVTLLDNTLEAFKVYLAETSKEIDVEAVLKQDLKSVMTQLDNVLLSWIVQNEYAKLRAQEIRVAGEVFAMQQEDFRNKTEDDVVKQAIEGAADVNIPWSINDES